MNFSIAWLILLLLASTEAHSQSVALEFIGHSHKAAVLNVSPDGKWLLSWDGVTLNTPSTNPGDRKVWNLVTKKWRDISQWNGAKIYDLPCGWTPDNRIWQLRTNPQPLAEGNAPYIAEFYLERPDGSGKILCTDPNEKVWFDDGSYFDNVVAHHFSSNGKQLFVLTNSYFRIFDATKGKMVFRRQLQPNERGETDLSDDGRTILAVVGEKNEQTWHLREARSGRLLRTLKAPKDADRSYLLGKDLFAYLTPKGAMIYGRLSDGKVLWKRGSEIYRTGLVTKLWIWNNVNGRDRVFAVPEQEQWVDVVITPDRKTIYGVNPSGDIYRFAAREIKPRLN